MAGHMGAERVTVQTLEVVRVDAERNLILIRCGSVRQVVTCLYVLLLKQKNPRGLSSGTEYCETR